MAHMDGVAAQQEMLERQVIAAAEIVEQELDNEIAKADNMDEDDLEVIRRKRLAQLKKAKEQKEKWAAKGHGIMNEFNTPQEFFQACKANERCVVHFYRDATDRCRIMDQHLTKIAAKHFETLFAKVHAEKVEGLAEQFNIIMLPTVMLIEGGKTHHSIIGFDEFGGTDKFPTSRVAEVLGENGMINLDGMLSADSGL
eukprot:TRINITY_DN30448_c0_g1_i1.p1 TRINITY_DN30448_c0_g1~~TRINITY_DN30448_c0_g1_i1.p1  ORF type:complete len:198 (+),score=116.71 TRINITY_DN30448_c0_g1_i1:54-647(+)